MPHWLSVCSTGLLLSFAVADYTREIGGHKLKIASHDCCPLVISNFELLFISLRQSKSALPATNDSQQRGASGQASHLCLPTLTYHMED